MIAFKADFNVSNEQLVQKAYAKMKECNADIIVANDVARKGSEMGSDTSEVFLISKDERTLHLSLDSKRNIARKLFEEIFLYF